MTGYPTQQSALFQRLAGRPAFQLFAWRGQMRHDLTAPIPGSPALAAGTPLAAASVRLLTACGQFLQWRGPLQPHFAYGALTHAEYEQAHAMHLANQFFEHSVHRRYIALVWGDFEEDEGTITGHVGRHLRFRKIMDVYPDGEHGKEAITHYRVLERLRYVTLVECRLETGRTHQIRVHMQHIGHSLFNDEVYGGDRILKGTVFTKYKQFVDNCFEICPRHALHARELGFIHPMTRQPMLFESKLADDIEQIIEKWRRYVKARQPEE
jgi:23S rRNA pseudouridine1911/1915/1917 synthase